MERIKPLKSQTWVLVEAPQLPSWMTSNKELKSLSFSSWTGSLLLVFPDALCIPPHCSLLQEADLQGLCHQMSLRIGFPSGLAIGSLTWDWREGSEVQYLLSSSLPAKSPPVSSVIWLKVTRSFEPSCSTGLLPESSIHSHFFPLSFELGCGSSCVMTSPGSWHYAL